MKNRNICSLFHTSALQLGISRICYVCIKKITHFHFETILYPSMYDSASSDINAPSPARSYNGTSLWVISVVSTETSIRACFDGLSIQKGCKIQIQVVNVLMLRNNNTQSQLPFPGIKHTTAVLFCPPTCSAGKYISFPLSRECLSTSWKKNIQTKLLESNRRPAEA